MPTYVYRCGECDEEWSEVHFIADRYECGPCPTCCGVGEKIITASKPHVFRKRWMEGINPEPVFVESGKQLNAIQKKNNCHIVSDDRRKQKRYYESRGMVEEGKRVCF